MGDTMMFNRNEETNMRKIGFDNEKYLSMQSEHIRERIGQFGDKLYLEFGGSYLTIIMRQEYFRDSPLTVSFRCFSSLQIRQR